MLDFEEYIRQGAPGKKEKRMIWQTAIGLQQVGSDKTGHRQIKSQFKPSYHECAGDIH